MRPIVAAAMAYSSERRRPPLRYAVDLRGFPAHLTATFVPSTCDAGTQRWLESVRNPSRWRAWCAGVLRSCFSLTTANGIVGRGTMHVLSVAQTAALLGHELPVEPSVEQARSAAASSAAETRRSRFDTLLDIGAGDGGVTASLARFCSLVYATEESPSMRWRLRRRGYHVLASGPEGGKQYDLVSCLNVLDRADKPLTLLQDLKAMLRPGGRVVMAVVLPWCPFVEDGTKKRAPVEALPMTGGRCCDKAAWEVSARMLMERVIEPAGFRVERWTRVPYLCEGSNTHEYYTLDDLVMCLESVPVPTAARVAGVAASDGAAVAAEAAAGFAACHGAKQVKPAASLSATTP